VTFVATIHVRPRSEVRDPQGDAVAGALRSIGLVIDSVRVGKEIVVRYEAADEPEARRLAETMGRELLANPVVEDFRVELRQIEGDTAELRVG
jgi:phosphoribosylformylglycinamidine synthase PurS subunit